MHWIFAPMILAYIIRLKKRGKNRREVNNEMEPAVPGWKAKKNHK